MIVLFTEEASMTPVLKRVMQATRPSAIEGVDWIIIAHRGKPDLHKNLVRKMREWNYGNPHFIILQDNDGGDCYHSKKKILELCTQTNKPYHVRIVCQELESWFIGDLNAVEKAFPKSHATKEARRPKFCNPDTLNKPSEIIAKLTDTGDSAKVGRAEVISKFLALESNRSPSFQLLIATLRQL